MSKQEVETLLKKNQKPLTIEDINKQIVSIDLVGKSDVLLSHAKGYIGIYLTRIGIYFAILIGVVAMGLAIALISPPTIILPILGFGLIIILGGGTVIVMGVDVLGSLIAASKCMVNNISLIAYDGVFNFLYRILVAGTLSWKYVFMKLPEKKEPNK